MAGRGQLGELRRVGWVGCRFSRMHNEGALRSSEGKLSCSQSRAW